MNEKPEDKVIGPAALKCDDYGMGTLSLGNIRIHINNKEAKEYAEWFQKLVDSKWIPEPGKLYRYESEDYIFVRLDKDIEGHPDYSFSCVCLHTGQITWTDANNNVLVPVTLKEVKATK